jgi:hypothetical protein
MLSSTVATIWQIRWTAGTRIVAVWVSGTHHNVVVGLPRNVPVLVTSSHNRAKSPCPEFTWYLDKFPGADQLAQAAFGRGVSHAFSLSASGSWVGFPPFPDAVWISSPDVPLRAVEHQDGWRHGAMALVALERDGYVRKALRQEVWAWEDAWLAKQDVPPAGPLNRPGAPSDRIEEFFVVQKPFRLPSGLCGGHAATFIVPKGMAVPTGEPCHAAIFDWNEMNCCGSAGYAICKSGDRPPPACKAR